MVDLTLAITDQGADLHECRRACLSAASSLGFSVQDAQAIGAAVYEACVNAVTHGRSGRTSQATLCILAHSDRFEAVISDQGRGFDPPGASHMPSPASIHGRGIPIMMAFMDKVTYDCRNGCKVTLVKYLRTKSC